MGCGIVVELQGFVLVNFAAGCLLAMGLKLADLGALTFASLILKLALRVKVPQDLFLSLFSLVSFGTSVLALLSAESAMKLGGVSSVDFFFLFGLLSLWTPRWCLFCVVLGVCSAVRGYPL